MLKTKIVSSLTKVYTDSVFDSLALLKKISMLRGERISFQLVTQYVKEEGDGKFTERKLYTPHILGALAGYVTLREVRNIPVELPTLPDLADDNYERLTPGLYPDLLEPLTHGGRVNARALFPSSVWVDVTVPERTEESELLADYSKYKVVLRLRNVSELLSAASESKSEKSARAYRVQALKRLPRLASRVKLLKS